MTTYRQRHLDGYHDADPAVRDKAAKKAKTEQKTTSTASKTEQRDA